MVLTSDPRARPASRLFAACAVTLICFWYPIFLGQQQPGPKDDRDPLSIEMSRWFPVAVLASLVALFSYFVLWRRARRCGGRVSWCLLSVGMVALLVASVPGLLVLAGLIALVWSSFVHRA